MTFLNCSLTVTHGPWCVCLPFILHTHTHTKLRFSGFFSFILSCLLAFKISYFTYQSQFCLIPLLPLPSPSPHPTIFIHSSEMVRPPMERQQSLTLCVEAGKGPS